MLPKKKKIGNKFYDILQCGFRIILFDYGLSKSLLKPAFNEKYGYEFEVFPILDYREISIVVSIKLPELQNKFYALDEKFQNEKNPTIIAQSYMDLIESEIKNLNLG